MFLATVAGSLTLSGCLSRRTDGPSTSPTSETETGVRHTADGITATFRVTDGHRPTDDSANATFNDKQVIVTGTMDPTGCNRPALKRVQYNTSTDSIHLRIGGTSPYDGTPTVECGNASYDYRCQLTVDAGQPTAVEVVHEYDGKSDRSFSLKRQ